MPNDQLITFTTRQSEIETNLHRQTRLIESQARTPSDRQYDRFPGINHRQSKPVSLAVRFFGCWFPLIVKQRTVDISSIKEQKEVTPAESESWFDSTERTALRRKLFGRTVVFHLAGMRSEFQGVVKRFEFVGEVESIDNKLVVRLDDPEKHNPDVVRSLVEAGAEIQFVGEVRQRLEEVYLKLVKA